MLGTELCGSIKNVIAIASGMLEGLGYNESTRCLLITKAADSIKELCPDKKMRNKILHYLSSLKIENVYAMDILSYFGI